MIAAHRFLAACALAGVLSAGGLVQAQPSQGPGGQQQPDIASLLHLRPDQQGALHAYQAAMRPGADEIAQRQQASPQALAELPTPARLDRLGVLVNLQQQFFRRTAMATRAFYGQLTPDQQRTFDRITTPPQNGARRGQ